MTTQRVAELLVAQADGWYEPWYGTPVAKQRVRFMAGSEHIGTIGVGDAFLTTGAAGLLLKDVDAGKCAAIRAAAGLGLREPR
jgi:hypothetical protein